MIVQQVPAQLPIWPDAVRGGPNVLLRSAFFAGIQSRQRRTLGTQTSVEKEPEGIVIAAQDGVSIKFAGTQHAVSNSEPLRSSPERPSCKQSDVPETI